MRINLLQTLLLATTISLPLDVSAVPCKKDQHTSHSLHARDAEPGIPFIPIPFPKPIVPPFVPKPITPISPVVNPIPPKPIAPAPPKPVAPAPPKPIEPVPPKPVAPPPPKPVEPAPPALQCKRSPGDDCIGNTHLRFTDDNLNTRRIKGESIQAELVAKQKGLNRDSKDSDVEARSKNYDFQVDEGLEPPISKTDGAFLSGSPVNVEFTADNTWIRTAVKSQADKIDTQILETYQHSKNRAIIIEDSRNKDIDELTGKDVKLFWSDMVMINLRKSFSDPSDLRYMVRNNIDAGGSAKVTRLLIDAAIRRTNGDPAKVNVFRSDPRAPGITDNELAAYQLIAGSDHGHRVLRMLTDYPVTMKNVRIESFSVTTPSTINAIDEYLIIIKFVKLENP